MTAQHMPSLMDQLAKASKDAREAAREAGTAARDARAARKELRDDIAKLTKEHVAALIEAEAVRQLEEMGSTIKHQMDIACRKVMREFDTLAEPLYETLGIARQAAESFAAKTEQQTRDRVGKPKIDIGQDDWTLKCEFCGTPFSDGQTMASIQVHFQLLHAGADITLITDWRGEGPPPLRNTDLLRLIKKSSNL